MIGVGGRLRASLVVVEVALALVLLIGAGLLARSVWSLLAVDPGFDTAGRLAARVTLPGADYHEDERIRSFWAALIERLDANPAVAAAAATSIMPMDAGDNDTSFRVEGMPEPDPSDPNVTWYRAVTAGYFETIGMRLVAGRGFTARDRDGAEAVAVVNHTLVRRYLPGGDPVGRRIRFGSSGDGPWLTIVGVVAGVRQRGLGEPTVAELFAPVLQRPRRSMMVVVSSTSSPPAALAPVLRSALRGLDPNLPIATPRPLDKVVLASVATPRLLMKMLVGFAALALVLGRGARLAGIGTLLGMAAVLAFGRLLQRKLYQVSPADPITLVGTAALLLLAALAACWLPARRAARLDPVIALREE